MTKVTCTFSNLTPKQAKVLAEWFDGAGEQDCSEWFEVHETPSPITKKIQKDKDGNVTVICQTFNEETEAYE